jgi:hypothetical protein
MWYNEPMTKVQVKRVPAEVNIELTITLPLHQARTLTTLIGGLGLEDSKRFAQDADVAFHREVLGTLYAALYKETKG